MKKSARVLTIALAAAAFLGVAGWRLASARRPAGDGGARPVGTVRLASRTVSFQAGARRFPRRFAAGRGLSARGTAAFVVSLPDADAARARRRLEALGARVVGYVPDGAFLVEAGADAFARIRGDEAVAGALAFAPADKFAPGFAAELAAASGTVEATVIPLSPDDVPALAAAVEAAGGAVAFSERVAGGRLHVRAPAALVASLASRGDVRWLERRRRARLLNDVAVSNTLMNVRAAWELHGLSGRGQAIAVADSGLDTGDLATIHGDFTNKAVGLSCPGGLLPSCADGLGHGTHVAGSAVGTGARSGGQYRGVAYDADLHCQRVFDDAGVANFNSLAPIFDEARVSAACRIHNDSWGNGSVGAGAYTDACVQLDDYTWRHPDFLPVFAAGNDGNAAAPPGSSFYTLDRKVQDPGSAKNALCVGATVNVHPEAPVASGHAIPSRIAYFSAQGPCADGRIKPDVVAPGLNVISCRSQVAPAGNFNWGVKDDHYAYFGGTSMAAPLVSGAAALVRQWLMEQGGFSNAPPSAALLKAVLTGGGVDLSRERDTNVAFSPVPSPIQGWGRVNLADSLFPGDGRAVRVVDRIPYRAGSLYSLALAVTNAAPFDVQLVWTDHPATAGSAKALVNDLDLEVSTPSGDVLLGNGGATADSVNNAESVRIAVSEVGTYVVRVRGSTVPHPSGEGGAAALYVRGAFDGGRADRLLSRRSAAPGLFLSLHEAVEEWHPSGTVVRVSVPEDLVFGSELYVTNGIRLRLATVAVSTGGEAAPQFSGEERAMATNLSLTLDRDTAVYFLYEDETATLGPTSIPLWWFERYLLGKAALLGCTNAQEIAAADFDADGFSNEEEYLADTRPVRASSALRFLSISWTNLVWTGGVESTQLLEASTAPAGPWGAIFTNAPPTALTNSLPLPAPGAGRAFFRVRALR